MTAKKRRAPRKEAAPGAGIRFGVSNKEYAAKAQAQREHIREAANRIERGASLEGMELRFIAEVLRYWADQLSDKQRRQRGRQPKMDPGALAIDFAFMTLVKDDAKGWPLSPAAAHAALAEQNGVTVEAVKNALLKYGDEAARMIQAGTFAGKKTKS